MTAYRENGVAITKATFPSAAVAVADPIVRVTEPVFEGYALSKSTRGHNAGRRLKYRTNDLVKQSEIDALFVAATLGTVNPASGPLAGGTNVTVTGTDLAGATGATLGGTAVTNFKVVGDTSITFTTPAGAAGVKPLVVADDSGSITKASAFTHV